MDGAAVSLTNIVLSLKQQDTINLKLFFAVSPASLCLFPQRCSFFNKQSFDHHVLNETKLAREEKEKRQKKKMKEKAKTNSNNSLISGFVNCTASLSN